MRLIDLPKHFLEILKITSFYGQKTHNLKKLKNLKNGHRMLKNASNELIFGPDNHFNGFYRFLKEFLKNVENCLIYGQKTLHFYTWAQKTANISETVHFETNKVGFSLAGFEILFEMACSGGP